MFAVNRHLMYLELDRSQPVEDNRGRPSGDFHSPNRIQQRRRKMAALRGSHG